MRRTSWSRDVTLCGEQEDSMRDPDESLIVRHLRAAYARAARARLEALRMLDAGFPSASFVWAVRAAEILLRDFVLAPHFLGLGLDWDEAMRQGSNVPGNSKWGKAFAKAEEWYGPFDEPLTTDDRNAWKVWDRIVRRRGNLIHGRPVEDAGSDEAAEVIDFAERMATWYAQRFLTSARHPIGEAFRDALAAQDDE